MNGRTMKEEKMDEVCVVCCREFNIYAVGVCDHAVCHECSTRMRALCRQSECPICRRDLEKVIFTKKHALFADLRHRDYKLSCKYDIFFENEDIRQAYLKLMEHVCKLCKNQPAFYEFNSLNDHVRRSHDLFYCDLCVEHLRIFTGERKCYTRQELAQHRRNGDKDDTSHRGHPLCEFCEERFLDNDELFRHLRRQHFFCHFCDADGCYQYYSDYEYLRAHFRKMHFLCEEESCKEESFTTVFRTEIDLKAHVATVHKNLSKAQVKHARTLELKFTITPRNGGGAPTIGLTDGSDRRARRHKPSHQDRYREDGAVGGANAQPQPPASVAVINTNSSIDFPSLSNSSVRSQRSQSSGLPQSSSQSGNATLANRLAKINRFNVREGADEFPALRTEPSVSSQPKNNFPQPKPVPVGKNVTSGAASVTVSSTAPVPAKNGKNQVTLRINSKKDFPSLSGQPQSNVSIHVRTENCSSTQNGAAGYNGDQVQGSTWVTVKKGNKKKEEIEMPVEERRQVDFLAPDRLLEEFPSLELKGKNKKYAANIQTVASVVQEDSKKAQESEVAKKVKTKKQKVKMVPVEKPTPVSVKPVEGKKKKKQAVLGNMATDSPEKKVPDLKRAEVKVTPAVKHEPKELFALKDFPSLKPKASLGFSGVNNTAPPPGFGAPAMKPNRNPPPGFGKNEDSERPIVTSNVTFTNSNGESFAMPTTGLRGYPRSYKEPDDFQNRSRELTDAIRTMLDEDDDKFQEFRNLSGRFRQGVLMAEEYYEHCTILIGVGKFDKIFPELLVLLPDIEKQQDLLAVYYSMKTSRKKRAEVSAVANMQFLICATCQQVLSANDFRPHMYLHETDEDFPSLPSQKLKVASPVHANVTWARKKN